MITDSTILQDFYNHPTDGQGVFVMFHTDGSFKWCPSGNELKRIYLLDSSKWISGPIFLPLSKEDNIRIMNYFDKICEDF